LTKFCQVKFTIVTLSLPSIYGLTKFCQIDEIGRQFEKSLCLTIEAAEPVVRVPLVVREGFLGGTLVTSMFSQKPGFTAF